MPSTRAARVGLPAGRHPFSRPQLLALVAGALQVVLGGTELFPIPEPEHALQICTGLLGLALCRNHHHARVYGITLAIVYGELLVATTSPLVLGLPSAEVLVYARTALVGVIITMVPTGRARAEQPPG